jgi:hypothetical protein
MHPIRQLLELSGILTVFFCGIVMSHYAWHNVTESSRITTKWAQESLFKHFLTIECRIWYLYIIYKKKISLDPFFRNVYAVMKQSLCLMVVTAGIYLQHCLSLLRHSSFFTLVWMHLTLISGRHQRKGEQQSTKSFVSIFCCPKVASIYYGVFPTS